MREGAVGRRGRTHPRRSVRRRRLAGVAVLLVAVVVGASCSGSEPSGSPSGTVSPGTAGDAPRSSGTTIPVIETRSYSDHLDQAGSPAPVKACVSERTAADPKLRALVEQRSPVLRDDFRQLGELLLACMTKEQFVAVMVAGMRLEPAQSTCMNGVLNGLSDEEVRALFVESDPAVAERISDATLACRLPS